MLNTTLKNKLKLFILNAFLVLSFLMSMTINSQEVGDEYLANPNINSTAQGGLGTTAGNFSLGRLGGWGAGLGGAFAACGGANLDCHSIDRMFKLFKKGGENGQYVEQTVVNLPAGNFNWSFWTKWDSAVDYNAGDAYEPTFTISTKDIDGNWVEALTNIPTQPDTVMEWVNDTGTWTNDIEGDVKIRFHKYGGTNAALTNLAHSMFIDDVSLTYASELISSDDDTTLSDLTVEGSTIIGFSPSETTYNLELHAATTTVPTVAATTSNAGATAVIEAATSIPGTTTIDITAADGTESTVSINFSLLPADLSLSGLTIDGATIAGFDSDETNYDKYLPQGTTDVPVVVATTTDATSSVVVTSALDIPGITTIVITGPDGTESTVSINFLLELVGVVGQEYLVNPNINTSTYDPNGVDGSGTFTTSNISTYGGWGYGANGAYASVASANGQTHSGDRMFKFFLKQDALVRQTLLIPPGIYSWSFWTKWADLVNWDTEGDSKPKFVIKTDDDGDGTWTAVESIITTQPTDVDTWVLQTGTYINDTQRQVRITFSKDGGTTAEPTNLAQFMFIDDVSFKFVGLNSWTGTTDTDWGKSSNWSSSTSPDATSEIFIPGDLSNYPIATSAVTVSSLTMGSGASFIANDGFTGAVTYNRNLGTNNWYLVSSPVVGETYDNDYVTTNQIASGNENNRGIAPYITADDTWNYMQAGATAATFDTGTGYSAKRSFGGDISFKGSMNTNDAGVDVVLSSDGNRFNLLGNPYTSHIASATFLTGEAAISETKNLWVWNQGTGTSGAYEVKTVADAMVIAPAQGFFVQANAAGGTFNFTESNQASSGGNFQRTDTRPEIYLTISDQTDAREAKIYYIENMTSGFDVGYEGGLFNGVSNPLAIYTHLVADSEGKNYQVQSLPTNNYENMIIPVGINAISGTAISIDASTNNFPDGINIYLEDKQDNSFTLLDADSSFNTTLENDLSGIGRFFLYTTAGTLSTDALEIHNNVSIYKTGNDNLRIVGVQNGTASIQIYNILGKQMMRTSFEGMGVNDISLPTLPIGVYIIKLATETGTTNKKIIIK